MDLSETELTEIYNHERYDKETIDFIEVFGAYVVSQLFNTIYNRACIAQEKSKKNSSIFDVYEMQMYLYIDHLKTNPGISKEIKQLHVYFNGKTQRKDTFSIFCQRFATVFVPQFDASNVMNIIVNSVRSVIICFIGEVSLGYLSLIIKQRADKDSPRQLQNKFIEIALLHKYTEHKKMRMLKTTSKTGINNEVINDMSSLLDKQRATISKLTQDNERLKKLLITQNSLVQKMRNKLAQPQQAFQTPQTPEPKRLEETHKEAYTNDLKPSGPSGPSGPSYPRAPKFSPQPSPSVLSGQSFTLASHSSPAPQSEYGSSTEEATSKFSSAASTACSPPASETLALVPSASSEYYSDGDEDAFETPMIEDNVFNIESMYSNQ